MTLNGGVWNLTQQSWVSKVDGNSGLIYLDGDGTGGYAVHIGKLEGDHTFVVNLNPEDYAASDMLYIYDGSSAGVQNLRINNEAEVLNALKDDGDRIRFATVGKTAGAGAGFGDDYVVRGRGVIITAALALNTKITILLIQKKIINIMAVQALMI